MTVAETVATLEQDAMALALEHINAERWAVGYPPLKRVSSAWWKANRNQWMAALTEQS